MDLSAQFYNQRRSHLNLFYDDGIRHMYAMKFLWRREDTPIQVVLSECKK